VKDGHDRYANVEINYFLQKIEQYASLAIPAAGNRSAIDDAFWRRFHFVISTTRKSAPETAFCSIVAC